MAAATNEKHDRLAALTESQRKDYGDFMAITKGTPAHRVAFAMNRLTPGTDWRKTPKGHIAIEWAKRNDSVYRSRLVAVTLERLEKALEAINQRYL